MYKKPHAGMPDNSTALHKLAEVITEVDESVNGFVDFYNNYHTYIWLAGIFLVALLVLHCCVVPLCLPCAVCYNCVKGCRQCFCCCASKRGAYSKQRNQEC